MVDTPKLDQMLANLKQYAGVLRALAAVPQQEFLRGVDMIGNAKWTVAGRMAADATRRVHRLISANTTTTATINAKAAVVTADDQTTTSGSTDPVFTFNVSGLEGGDSLAGVSCGVTGAHTDAGTYTISCAGNTNTNYAGSYVAGTLTVNPAEPQD